MPWRRWSGLCVVFWRTHLVGGTAEIIQRARVTETRFGLQNIDLLTLEMDGYPRDPGVLSDLRCSEVIRWISAAGPANAPDIAIQSGAFDGMTFKLDPAGSWNERNRIKTPNTGDMGVVAFDVELESAVADGAEPTRTGLFKLFTRQQAPPISNTFRLDVPGWTDQQIIIVHALTDPLISTLVVQPSCIPTLEILVCYADQDLPAGAQAQIEMARFSNGVEDAPHSRQARR